MKTDIFKNKTPIITEDPWTDLRNFTDARIALGHCGVAPPLQAILEFKLAHAQARDAVHCGFEKEKLLQSINEFHSSLLLKSEIKSRNEYLTRPDEGRRLSQESILTLENLTVPAQGYDVCLIIGDGLSARAIHENSQSFLKGFFAAIAKTCLSVAPISIVENARVAVSDSIGHALKAKVSVILIGERPGLSSPNSMGIYLTFDPKPGKTDESRNCISNIRTGGLSVEQGVQKLCYLIEQALLQKRSGVQLKDLMESNYLPFIEAPSLLK